MEQAPRGDCLYSFGPYVLDPVRRVLRKDGRIVPLRPKALEVLLILVEHRGELLSKDKIFSRVWPDSIVEENNLARQVSNLRRVLQQDETGQDEYIINVPLRGYRFVAPVAVADVPVAEVRQDTQARTGPARSDGDASQVPSPEGAPHHSEPVLAPRAGVMTWVGLAAALMIVVLTTSFTDRRGSASTVDSRGSVPHRRLWQLTFSPGVQDEPVWSPSGEWIAYSADRAGNADIWVQPVGRESPRQLTTSAANDWQPAWSPDGRFVAFRSERGAGGLYVVAADGSGERKIAGFGYRPKWAPDGSKLMFYGTLRTPASRWTELFEVPAAGGEPVSILGSIVSRYVWFHAAWHPGDDRISIYGARQDGSTEMVTTSIDGSRSVTSRVDPQIAALLREDGVRLGAFVWAPRGDKLFFEGMSEGVRNIWRVRVDPLTLAWTSEAERLTTGAELHTNIHLSSDGKRIAFSVRTENTRLWSFPFEQRSGRITGSGEPLTAEGADAPYDVSFDGRRLVYRALRQGRQELWERTLANGQNRLLVNAESISAPRFSRDGGQVAYRRGSQEQQVIAALRLDTGDERVLTQPKYMRVSEVMAPFDWSMDDTYLVGSCSDGSSGTIGICRVSAGKGAPVAIASPHMLAMRPGHSLYEAQISPDGRWVSFNAVSRGQSIVYVVSIEGGNWIPITRGGGFWDDKPRWSPDGRMLYFSSIRRGAVNIWAQRFDSVRGETVGEPFEVTTFESPSRVVLPRIVGMHVVVGDNRIILPMTDVSASVWVLENVDE